MSGADSAVAMLVWCPFADEESAARVAELLLDEGLIACANILAPMRSYYRWDGERGEARETPAIFKTNAAALAAMQTRLAELHPYDEPAILAWECDAPEGTRQWLAKLGA